MASSSKDGEGSWSGAGGASSAGEAASAAEPQQGTSSQLEPGMTTTSQGEKGCLNVAKIYSKAHNNMSFCDIFVTGYESLPAALADLPVGLPPGKYKLVACELATTGRRLIDEIFIIAAYTRPEKSFIQYVMPHGDLHPGARHRHHIRVYSTEIYRMLRSTVTHKVVKSKTELGALEHFLVWLSSIKQDDEKIILLYHDPRRLTPIKILQAILRFNLLDDFMHVVAGFSDSYALCYDKCGSSFKSVSIHSLARVLLDEGSQGTESVMERAMAIYNVLEQLASQGCELHGEAVGGVGCQATSIENEMIRLACAFGRPVYTELEAFRNMKDLVERQDSFRLALVPLLSGTNMERRRLTLLRRVLAEAGLLFDQIKDAWYDGKRAGLLNLFSSLDQVIKGEEIIRLASIFVSYFNSTEDEKSENSEGEEKDELYWSSDLDDNSDGDRDSPGSPGGPGGFATAEDYLDF